MKNEAIDLIIPSTDYEVYYLAKYENEIPCEVIVSSFKTASHYLDKFNTFEFFQTHNIPFGASYLPSQYSGEFSDCIAKPRKRSLSLYLRDFWHGSAWHFIFDFFSHFNIYFLEQEPLRRL